jgi:hypothetical protein
MLVLLPSARLFGFSAGGNGLTSATVAGKFHYPQPERWWQHAARWQSLPCTPWAVACCASRSREQVIHY